MKKKRISGTLLTLLGTASWIHLSHVMPVFDAHIWIDALFLLLNDPYYLIKGWDTAWSLLFGSVGFPTGIGLLAYSLFYEREKPVEKPIDRFVSERIKRLMEKRARRKTSKTPKKVLTEHPPLNDLTPPKDDISFDTKEIKEENEQKSPSLGIDLSWDIDDDEDYVPERLRDTRGPEKEKMSFDQDVDSPELKSALSSMIQKKIPPVIKEEEKTQSSTDEKEPMIQDDFSLSSPSLSSSPSFSSSFSKTEPEKTEEMAEPVEETPRSPAQDLVSTDFKQEKGSRMKDKISAFVDRLLAFLAKIKKTKQPALEEDHEQKEEEPVQPISVKQELFEWYALWTQINTGDEDKPEKLLLQAADIKSRITPEISADITESYALKGMLMIQQVSAATRRAKNREEKKRPHIIREDPYKEEKERDLTTFEQEFVDSAPEHTKRVWSEKEGPVAISDDIETVDEERKNINLDLASRDPEEVRLFLEEEKPTKDAFGLEEMVSPIPNDDYDDTEKTEWDHRFPSDSSLDSVISTNIPPEDDQAPDLSENPTADDFRDEEEDLTHTVFGKDDSDDHRVMEDAARRFGIQHTDKTQEEFVDYETDAENDQLYTENHDEYKNEKQHILETQEDRVLDEEYHDDHHDDVQDKTDIHDEQESLETQDEDYQDKKIEDHPEKTESESEHSVLNSLHSDDEHKSDDLRQELSDSKEDVSTTSEQETVKKKEEHDYLVHEEKDDVQPLEDTHSGDKKEFSFEDELPPLNLLKRHEEKDKEQVLEEKQQHEKEPSETSRQISPVSDQLPSLTEGFVVPEEQRSPLQVPQETDQASLKQTNTFSYHKLLSADPEASETWIKDHYKDWDKWSRIISKENDIPVVITARQVVDRYKRDDQTRARLQADIILGPWESRNVIEDGTVGVIAIQHVALPEGHWSVIKNTQEYKIESEAFLDRWIVQNRDDTTCVYETRDSIFDVMRKRLMDEGKRLTVVIHFKITKTSSLTWEGNGVHCLDDDGNTIMWSQEDMTPETQGESFKDFLAFMD